MFEAPSRDDITRVVVDAAAVRGEDKPRIVTLDGAVINLAESISPAA